MGILFLLLTQFDFKTGTWNECLPASVEEELRLTPSALGKEMEPRAGGTYRHQGSHTVTQQRGGSKLCSKMRNWPNVCKTSIHCTTSGLPLLGDEPSKWSHETLVWHSYVVKDAKETKLSQCLIITMNRTMGYILLAQEDFSIWWGKFQASKH